MKTENTETWRDWYGGQSELLLKELHLITRDGKLNQDSRRKLKQVSHLVQLIEPYVLDTDVVMDLGAGKSYLGLIVYDVLLRSRPESRLVGVERRLELVKRAQAIAVNSGFDRARFIENTISGLLEATDEGTASDVVLALHACDTATDEAIALGLKHKARVFALVPCCQAELAQKFKATGASDARLTLKALFEQPLHRREFASHMTNVLRCLVLESAGYKVTVTELVGFEHSMKNELILAERKQGVNRARAKQQLLGLCQEFGVDMRELRLGSLLAEIGLGDLVSV